MLAQVCFRFSIYFWVGIEGGWMEIERGRGGDLGGRGGGEGLQLE